jgi:N,N'-diacetyllegionaminate synthase
MHIIAETAWHHEGDCDFLLNLTDKIIQSGAADVLKYHLTLDLDEYMARDHEAFQTLEQWMISVDGWCRVFELCREKKTELMLLLNDSSAIEFGLNYAPKLVEIHSVCLNDLNLLSALKSNLPDSVPVVIGVGGTSLEEIDHAVNYLQRDNIVLMFGFQNYPTRLEHINLLKIKKIMSMYPDFSFGYADHTGWDEADNILVTLLGASAGMSYVEKHVTTEYGVERCDWQAAISIDMLTELAEKLKVMQAMNGDGSLDLNEGEKSYSVYGPMKKAPIASRALKQGHVLCREDIAFKRTKNESSLSQTGINKFIGTPLRQDVAENEIFSEKQFL